ncbi:MAG: PaaI family thioesterase [Bacillota bacterium]
MKSKFSGYREKVLRAFHNQSIVHTLGIQVLDFGEGWFHTRFIPNERILQHHGYVRAGAIATMADLSSGFASCSLIR